MSVEPARPEATAGTLLASVNGSIGKAAEASIPVADEGLLRGDGAFEVLRLYRGRPFALDDHLARLGRTCAGLRLAVELDLVEREISALLAQNGPADALLRVVITRGGRRILIVEPLPQTPATARVATVTYAPTRVLDGLKTLSYAANMLAGRIAREHGADEALLVTPHGRILEGPTWTFFWSRGGALFTPPLSERILDSITRARILEEVDVREEVCVIDEVTGFEEAFIASSVREVLPIASIDDHSLPLAPGPLTRAVSSALTARIERELAAAPA